MWEYDPNHQRANSSALTLIMVIKVDKKPQKVNMCYLLIHHANCALQNQFLFNLAPTNMAIVNDTWCIVIQLAHL